jgi:plastocyanin
MPSPLRRCYLVLQYAVLAACCNNAQAKDLSFRVLTADNKPLSEAVVWLTPNIADNNKHNAVMDQLHKTFVPYILPVQVGTIVDFPNSDSINHHVYSFSPAKRFELKLSPSSQTNHTMLFDKAGIVTLGCNIHDWMLAYVVVLETPYFSQTDTKGFARIKEPEGGANQVHLWHPQINDKPENLAFPINNNEMTLTLKKPLKPDLRRSAHGY